MPKSSTLRRPSLEHEEVVGLDVAVDDALRVRRGEHVEQLVDEAQQLASRPRRRAWRASSESGVALEQLHHQEGRAVLGDVDVADLDRRPGA